MGIIFFSVIFSALVTELLLCVTELVTSSLLLRGVLKVRVRLYKPSYGFCDVRNWEEKWRERKRERENRSVGIKLTKHVY